MKKKRLFIGFVILVIVILLSSYIIIGKSNKDEVLEEDIDIIPEVIPVEKETPIEVPTNEVIDWNKYNYDFVDENVKNILTSMIRNRKTAFYLPPTRYINVSRGDKFGVAFALNNPNPSGENNFEYEWTVDDSIKDNCGVSVNIGQSWIERGWTSWGKIPKGWVDHMTVYFSFPEDAPQCNVKYNFEIKKDNKIYDTKQIEFNII
ncbi:hypothetical protein KAJ38_02180 [Candidatus Pacearchaeota archaeon]|nr:hypothetical protein [Candidatus Pacearchaeota archaeon]